MIIYLYCQMIFVRLQYRPHAHVVSTAWDERTERIARRCVDFVNPRIRCSLETSFHKYAVYIAYICADGPTLTHNTQILQLRKI